MLLYPSYCANAALTGYCAVLHQRNYTIVMLYWHLKFHNRHGYNKYWTQLLLLLTYDHKNQIYRCCRVLFQLIQFGLLQIKSEYQQRFVGVFNCFCNQMLSFVCVAIFFMMTVSVIYHRTLNTCWYCECKHMIKNANIIARTGIFHTTVSWKLCVLLCFVFLCVSWLVLLIVWQCRQQQHNVFGVWSDINASVWINWSERFSWRRWEYLHADGS